MQTLFLIFSLGILAGVLLACLLARVVARLSVRGSEASSDYRYWAPRSQIKLLRQLLADQSELLDRCEQEYEIKLQEFREAYEQRAGELDGMRTDVRDAVLKTRELRAELIDRAVEDTRRSATLKMQNAP